MAQCEVCGNEYDKTFEVRLGGQSHIFDSFECAIHALAPRLSKSDFLASFPIPGFRSPLR